MVLVELPQLRPTTGVAEEALGEGLDRLAALDPTETWGHGRLGNNRRSGVIELIVNGRGDANVAADTKFGASDEMAVRPAAIHRPRPANIANCGTHERSALPRASKIEASTDSTIASHSAHADDEQNAQGHWGDLGRCQAALEVGPDLVRRSDRRQRLRGVESGS